MTFPLGKTLAGYFAGYPFSGWSNKYTTDLKINALDSTTFGPSLHKTQAPGLLEGKITVNGFYLYTLSPDVTGVENQIGAALRVNTVGLVALPGAGSTPAAGDEADLWIATALTRKIGVTVDGLITLDADIETGTGLHYGVVAAPETAYTPNVQTAYYDQGGAGWLSAVTRYLVVVQVTAWTSGMAALAVETSTDHATWTPRGTFPAITGIGGYALPLVTTLDRYVRINGTGVGTVIVGFAPTY